MRPPLPLRRWTINLLCAASLLIFLLAMGIWVRSYFADEMISRVRFEGSQIYTSGIGCMRGSLVLWQRVERTGGRPAPVGVSAMWNYWRDIPASPSPLRNQATVSFLGFALDRTLILLPLIPFPTLSMMLRSGPAVASAAALWITRRSSQGLMCISCRGHPVTYLPLVN